MKNILIMVLILTLGFFLNPISFANTDSQLDEQYARVKQNIMRSCARDAKNSYDVAKRRDAGVPLEIMQNRVMERAKLYNSRLKAQGKKPIKVQDLIFVMLLIEAIYNSPDRTPQQIYNEVFKNCTRDLVKSLEEAYNYEKQKRFRQKQI